MTGQGEGLRGLARGISKVGTLLTVLAAGFILPASHACAFDAMNVTAQEQGSGPYPAVFDEDVTLPAHVVYHPQNLSGLKSEKLGVYVFGNGGCSADGTSSRNHLLEIASHGYVAIAPGTDPAKHPVPPPPPMTNGQLSAATKASALSDAIDWAIKENSRPESPYFGKIDTGQIAVSGWSCGGLQALIIASDPRVRTVVVMNSGVFNDPTAKITGIELDKFALKRLHGSALYVLGGPDDIAYKNGTDDFARLSGLPAALVNIPVGHGGTYMQPHGGIAAEVVVNWLDWQLKGRANAAKAFKGAACTYCRDPRLSLERKGID